MNNGPAAAEPVWTSLEVAKLAVSVLLPLAVLFLGIWVRRFTERLERRGRLSQIEVEWRLSVFKQLAPRLNDLFCYFTYVGAWREMTPMDAVAAKRECDRIVHTNRFLWSPAFTAAYAAFTAGAFVEAGGRGQPLRLRANRDRHRENDIWRDAWQGLFVDPKDRVTRADFTRLYDAVLDQAVRDLGIVDASPSARWSAFR